MKVVKNKYYLIVSLALGDGHIDNQKHIKKSMLDIAHHVSHADYIKFKKTLLEKQGFIVNHSTKVNSNGVVFSRINTRYYKIMRDVRQKLYNTKTKLRIFPKQYVKNLSLFHLMILYLDDGSLLNRVDKKTGNNNYYIEISLGNYSIESVQNIKLWINTLGYDCNIHQTTKYKKANKNNGYLIRINKSNSSQFLNKIRDYVCKNIPSMEYKVKPIL